MVDLKAELDRLEQERARLDVLIEYTRDLIGRNSTARRKPRARPSGRLTAADAAAQVLAEKGEPMRTADLLTAVQQLGARMKDTDGLYKTLSRSPQRFNRTGRGLWTLTEGN